MHPRQAAAPADDVQLWRRKSLLALIVSATVLFGAAGTVSWFAGWAYLVVVTGAQLSTTILLKRISPDLLVERSKMQAGTKSWDKVLAPLIAIVLPFATWIVAGLDHRFEWTRPLHPLAQAAGLLVVICGTVVTAWAMVNNRFFAATVRIQRDRNQTVVSSGPYRFVRHPGYTGALIFLAATPFALGSMWAYVPTGLCCAVLVLRTYLEDRTLQKELGGYTEYAARVRSRLVPGIW